MAVSETLETLFCTHTVAHPRRRNLHSFTVGSFTFYITLILIIFLGCEIVFGYLRYVVFMVKMLIVVL